MNIRIRCIICILFFANLLFIGCESPVVGDSSVKIKYPLSSEGNKYPSLSPDGKEIVYQHRAFSSNDSIYPTGLYIVNVESGEKRLLIKGNMGIPKWSPVDNRILFRYGTLYTINSDGTGLKKLLNNDQDASESAWSKDGKKICFWGWKEGERKDTAYLWIVNSDGSNLKPVLPGHRDPSWSPDGKEILCVGTYSETGAIGQLFKYNIEEDSLRIFKSNKNARFFFPSWSSDNEIVYGKKLREKVGDVYIMNADGTNDRKIIEGGSFMGWSKDGSKIVYTDSDRAISIINADGTNKKTVLTP